MFGGFHFSVDYMSVNRLRAEFAILHTSLAVFTRRSGKRRNNLVLVTGSSAVLGNIMQFSVLLNLGLLRNRLCNGRQGVRWTVSYRTTPGSLTGSTSKMFTSSWLVQ